MRVTYFEVWGLFGLFNHKVVLNQDARLTIICGPNGYGKTTLLRLVKSFFSKDFDLFTTTPFARFDIGFDNGCVFTVLRAVSGGSSDSSLCTVSVVDKGKLTSSQVLPIMSRNSQITKKLEVKAPYMQWMGGDVWEDGRDGELVPTEELLDRYKIRLEEMPPIPWLEEVTSAIDVRLIETQRLLELSPAVDKAFDFPIRRRSRRNNSASIVSYAGQLAQQMRNASIGYASVSQQLDRTFVVRLLQEDFKGTGPLPDSSLKSKIDNLNEKRRRLRDAGLLTKDDQELPQPQEYGEQIEEILSAYLQDVENKLKVFDRLLEKIELLREMVNSRLQFKQMAFNQSQGFIFRTASGENLSPEKLSSGEQHILIQIYDLLFSDSADSLILIDEPELSLHVAWQLSFLDGLQQITRLVPHDVILATHSPQIIGDRWDLATELAGPEEAPLVPLFQ